MFLNILFSLTLLTSGYSSAYSHGVFERVIATRQAGKTAYNIGIIPSNIDGYIAIEDCSLINTVIMVCFPSGCEHLLVADCAGVADGGRAWMHRSGVVGEVDPDTFARHKLSGEYLLMHLYLIKSIPRYKFN